MENKKNYNFGNFKKGEKSSFGYVEGWTFERNGAVLNARTVNVKGEEKRVASFNVSTHLAKSVLEYNFGKELATEVSYIEVTAWGKLAERLEKFNPVAKSLLGLIGDVAVQEYDKKDGSKGQKLVMTLVDFKSIKKGSATSTSEDVTPSTDEDEMPF